MRESEQRDVTLRITQAGQYLFVHMLQLPSATKLCRERSADFQCMLYV